MKNVSARGRDNNIAIQESLSVAETQHCYSTKCKYLWGSSVIKLWVQVKTTSSFMEKHQKLSYRL